MGSSRLFRMARGVQARAIDTIGRNRGSDERCRTAGVCNSAIRRMSASGQTRSPSSVAIGGRCSSESGYHQCRPRFLRWAMPPAPILDPSLRPFPWSHRRDRLSDRREGSRMRRREFIAGVGGAVARSSTMGLCVWVGARGRFCSRPESFMPRTIWRSSIKASHGTISCIAHLAAKTRRCPR
jgi:hypothetical protein